MQLGYLTTASYTYVKCMYMLQNRINISQESNKGTIILNKLQFNLLCLHHLENLH